MAMPKQKPGKSKQDYETPASLIKAVTARFGKLQVDLAALPSNAKCPTWVTPEQNSLLIDWVEKFGGERCWLNPPFANIEPWAEKCADFARRAPTGRIFFLTPASVGANWYKTHVHGQGYVMALNGRPTFVGEESPYPKDCMITMFGQRVAGFEVWPWNFWPAERIR